jgi:hypothetical protein
MREDARELASACATNQEHPGVGRMAEQSTTVERHRERTFLPKRAAYFAVGSETRGAVRIIVAEGHIDLHYPDMSSGLAAMISPPGIV